MSISIVGLVEGEFVSGVDAAAAAADDDDADVDEAAADDVDGDGFCAAAVVEYRARLTDVKYALGVMPRNVVVLLELVVANPTVEAEKVPNPHRRVDPERKSKTAGTLTPA